MPEEYRGFRVEGPEVVERMRAEYEFDDNDDLVMDEQGEPKIIEWSRKPL